MNNASSDPRYRRAKSRYRRASAVIEHAKQHIAATVDLDAGDYNMEFSTFDAERLLEAAAKRLNADFSATTKALGVGVYQPYGRPARRRF